MDKLVCDRCGQTYFDQESIDMAKATQEEWARLCREDGTEPRGLIGCPAFTCPGEMILKH